MQAYVVLMAIALGTLLDAYHKGNAKFYFQRKEKTRAAAQRPIGAGTRASLAARAAGEALVSGEFCKRDRRASHLLMMYGFIVYVMTISVYRRATVRACGNARPRAARPRTR